MIHRFGMGSTSRVAVLVAIAQTGCVVGDRLRGMMVDDRLVGGAEIQRSARVNCAFGLYLRGFEGSKAISKPKDGGHGWDRTSYPSRVKRVLYR
jgi:hypothetical protein